MRKELSCIVSDVSARCCGAKAVVLPYPYRTGHLRIYTDACPDLGADYTAERRGSNLFVTITDERLLSVLAEMDEGMPKLCIEPQRSTMSTLLYQILKRNWTADKMDEPLLARMILDLDGDAERCRRILGQIEPHLSRAYAQALRENRKHSVLTAVARQAVHYMNLHDI